MFLVFYIADFLIVLLFILCVCIYRQSKKIKFAQSNGTSVKFTGRRKTFVNHTYYNAKSFFSWFKTSTQFERQFVSYPFYPFQKKIYYFLFYTPSITYIFTIFSRINFFSSSYIYNLYCILCMYIIQKKIHRKN